MAIDASIYNLLAQPRKSAFDYAAEYEQQDANRLAQAQSRQLNALQIGAAQDQATERQRTLAEDQAWRDFMGSGADLRTPQGLSAGMKISPSRVQAWQAADLAAREKQSVIDKNTAARDKDQFELDNRRTDLALMTGIAGRTPSAIKALISQGVSKKVLSMQQATEILSDLPTDEQAAADPGLLRRWRLQAIEHGLDRKDYLANEWKRQEAERAARNEAATNANRPLVSDGNGGWKVNQPYVDAQSRIAQAGASVTMGAPIQGIDPKTGLPVFFQPGNRPGVAPQIVQGVTPPPSKEEKKPLPGQVVQAVTEARDHAATINNLKDSFKDEYAGKGVFGIGADASLIAKGVTGTDQGSVQWWKDYRKQSELIERNRMFGASLTEGEKASWQSADISPGMSPKTIKANLATRAALADKVLEFTKQDMIDAGHNPERVSAIADRKAPKGGSPAAPAAPKPGDVVQGYRFKGGNPADKANWEKL